MTTLPSNTPRWLIWLLNLIAVGVLSAIGFLAKWAGWQFCAGFLAGFFLLYIHVRIRYGFWPEP